MNKAALLIPYFGQWPAWIELYWHSCAQNSDYDFFFFTDCVVPEKHGENLHFQSLSFADYCAYVSEQLHINFTPPSSYYLCALKPFYGYIHRDILTTYSHWGFCDVDLIFGRLSSFVDLSKYDVYSTHVDRLSGHFCLLRNNEYFRMLAFRIKHWQAKLTGTTFYPLDESEFSSLVYPASWFLRKFYTKVMRRVFNWRDAYVLQYAVLGPLVNALCLSPLFSRYKMHFVDMHTTPVLPADNRLTFRYDSERWYYHDGDIINARTQEKSIYVHFMIYKKNGFRTDHFWRDSFYHLSPSDFHDVVIDKQGFRPNSYPVL